MKRTEINKVIAKRPYKAKFAYIKSNNIAYKEMVIIRDFTNV